MFPKVIKPLLIGCLVLMAVGQSSRAEDQFAQVEVKGGQISFYPLSPPVQLMLTVSGPDFYVQMDFAPDDVVSVQLDDESGQPLPDGIYKYELRTQPAINEVAVKKAEHAGDHSLLRELWETASRQTQVQNGSFKITNGSVEVVQRKTR